MNQEKKRVVELKSKPRVRQAVVDDFDKVYPLLKQMNNTRLGKKDWFRLFENYWGIDEFSPGIVLEFEDEIVGYIGTIFSRQIIDGESKLFCNLTTWIVLDEYRSHSIMMIFSLVRRKDLILTSFSSNDITYEIYKKLGFRDGNRAKRIVYPLPSLRSKNYQLTTDIREMLEIIKPENRVILDAHKDFGNAYVLIRYPGKECLVMGVVQEKQLNIYFVSDTAFFGNHLKFFRNRMMSRFGAKKIVADEHLLAGAPMLLSRKVVWGNPYQYKATQQNDLCIKPVYSEIFMLNM